MMIMLLLLLILILGQGLGLAATVGHCEDSFIMGEITPENRTKAYFGEDFTLTCSVTSASPSAAKGRLYMKASSFDGGPEPRLLQHNTSGSIEMQGITIRERLNSSYSQQARYVHFVCYYTDGTNDSDCQLADWYIEIDHRPRAPINGSCVVYNWDSMRCVWDLVVSYRRTNISLKYNITDITLPVEERLKGGVNYSLSRTHWLPCPHQSQNNNMLVCEFKERDGANSFIPGKYFFVVKISNSTGHAVYTDLNVLTDTIVKPAKLSKLELSPNRTSIKLHMKKEKARSVLFKVQYHSEWDVASDSWFKKEENTSKAEITLEKLKPYTLYHIRVNCIPLLNGTAKGYWSEPTLAEVRTLEDVPSAVPEFFQGHFTCVSENCTRIILYWKPIDKRDRNGVITKYNITLVTKETEKSEHYISRNETEINGNASFYQVDIQSDMFNIIYLSQRTKVGYPDMEKKILLAPLYRRPPAPADIRVESHNKTRVKVMWKPVSDSGVSKGYYKRLYAYIVFWCEYHEKKKLTCKDGIHFQVLPSYHCSTEYCSMYVDALYHEICLYGVSTEAELSSGTLISSGIAWKHCSYSKSKDLEPLDVKLQQQEENSFQISWKKTTCGPFVHNYVIYICEGKECDHKDEEVLEVHVENNVTSYRMTDLKPSTTSKIWVVGNYSGRISPIGDPVILIPSVAAAEGSIGNEDNGINVGLIIAICVPVAFIAGVIVFICIKCRRYVRRANSETRDIDLPEIKTNGMMESKLDEEARYTPVFVKRAEDEPLLSKPNPSTGSTEQNRNKSPEKVDPRKKYSAVTQAESERVNRITQAESERVNRDSGYASPANETQVLNYETESRLQSIEPLPKKDNVVYVQHPNNSIKDDSGVSSKHMTSDLSNGSSSFGQNSEQNTKAENPSYTNSDQHTDNVPVPSDDLNAAEPKVHYSDKTSTSVNPVVMGSFDDSTNPYVSHDFDGGTVGNMASPGSLLAQQRDTSNTTVSTISPYVQHSANFENINSKNSFHQIPMPADNGSCNRKLHDLNSQGSRTPYYVIQATDLSSKINSTNSSTNSTSSIGPYVTQTANTHDNLNSSSSAHQSMRQAVNTSSVDPYVRQTADTNGKIEESTNSLDPYVRQTADTSGEIVNSTSSVDPYVRQTASSNGEIVNSTSSIDPYVRQTANTSGEIVNSTSSVDPYVRQTANTSGEILDSASSVDPYVKQAADSSCDLKSTSSLDPYLRQTADTSCVTLNSVSSVNPYVRQIADTSESVLDTSSELNSANSIDPYVRQATDTSGITLNSANSMDPYVRQSADTSGVTLNSANSIDTYVRQAADTSGVTLNSANSVDPYVRQTADTSGVTLNSANSMDPYVRQSADTSEGILDTSSDLNSASSIDPYVRQAADTSGITLNSASSVDPYVRQTADTSGGILDTSSDLNTASSIDPYVRQAADTSCVTLNSANSVDSYVRQTADSSGGILYASSDLNSASSVDPYVRQAADTSGGILDTSSDLNSASSIDPYVRQSADTSCVTLNSANSVDPYVGQTADSSCVTVDSTSSIDPYVRQTADSSCVTVDSTSSLDPYVRQIADTSDAALDSPSCMDPYLRQTADSSGIAIDSTNSSDSNMTQNSGSRSVNMLSESNVDPLSGESQPEASNFSDSSNHSASLNSGGQGYLESTCNSNMTTNCNVIDSNTSGTDDTQSVAPNESHQTIVIPHTHNPIGHNINQTFRTLSNGYVQSVIL